MFVTASRGPVGGHQSCRWSCRLHDAKCTGSRLLKAPVAGCTAGPLWSARPGVSRRPGNTRGGQQCMQGKEPTGGRQSHVNWKKEWGNKCRNRRGREREAPLRPAPFAVQPPGTHSSKHLDHRPARRARSSPKTSFKAPALAAARAHVLHARTPAQSLLKAAWWLGFRGSPGRRPATGPPPLRPPRGDRRTACTSGS